MQNIHLCIFHIHQHRMQLTVIVINKSFIQILNTVIFNFIHSNIITVNKLNNDNHQNINIHSCNILNGHSNS